MRKISLALFVSLSSTTLIAQIHKIGIGAGVTSFEKWNVDVHYQFNYKLLFAHAGYIHSDGYPKEFYKSLDQFSAILGIQTTEKKRFIFHVGLGACYFQAINHIHDDGESYTDPQYNPILLVGLKYKLLEKHQLEANIYGSQITFRSQWGPKTHYSGGFCSYLTLCYVYKFGKIVKD